ncbi:MAG TPA: alcohol dehydrogenase catalytic domain-containing protein, partial [Thermoanaerobaculia bacterium]
MISSETKTEVAACVGGGATRVESRPLRSPGTGEVLLRLRVSGLCGTDLYKLATGSFTPGAVLGHEIVGMVEAIGAGVTGFDSGDRVV